MGGAVRVIVKQDDVIHKHTRHTNALPDFVKSDKFIECDKKYMNDYLNVKSDYSSDKDTFSPDGYGLVVLDMDSKTIISSQGYCSFEYIMLTTYALYEMGCVMGVDKDSPYYYPNTIKRMWEKDMLSATESYLSEGKVESKLINPSFEELHSMAIDRDNQQHVNLFINWDKFDWTLIELGEGDIINLFKEVTDRYLLEDEDLDDWKSYINYDSYDEDSTKEIKNMFSRYKAKVRQLKLKNID